MSRAPKAVHSRAPPRLRRLLLRVLLGTLVLALASAAGAWLWLQRTVTPVSGRLAVAGLDGAVEIVMRPDAIPHVFAGSKEDLYSALGLLHAQHRLWQMELMRRAGQGRLSEIFGASTLDRDKLIRTLDLYGHAERSGSVPRRARRSTPMRAASMPGWRGLRALRSHGSRRSSTSPGTRPSRGGRPTASSFSR